MFGKLKNKLKDWTSKVADAEEEIKELEEIQEEETIEESPEEEKKEKKGFFKKLFSKKEKEEETEEEIETLAEEIDEKSKKKSAQKKQDTDSELGGVQKRGLPSGKEEDKALKKEAKKEKKEKKKKRKEKKETTDIDNSKLPSGEELKEDTEKESIAPQSEARQSLASGGEELRGVSPIAVSTPGSGKTEPDTEKLEDIKEKLPTDEEIDKKLKEELDKGDYKEAKKTFNEGAQSYYPDLDKSIEKLAKEEKPKEEKKKTSLFKKLTSSKRTISEDEFDEHAEDLEMILLENNVALEVVDKILEELKQKIVGVEMSKKEILDKVTESLSEKIKEVLQEPFDMIKEIQEKDGVYTVIFCGINGVGKTTQIAKFANMLKQKGISCVMAAGDTFRAAAVEQLKTHGEKLNIKVIAHDYGSDPASVGFDAIKYAEKNNVEVVLIDTAGRIHTATNLLKEMEKIKRVCKPDRTIFVGESITGNDAVDQVKAFNDNIGIDGIFLSKADIDEKGGTALSVGYITEKPIIFLGTGQNYEDIEPFDKKKFLEKLDLE